MIEGSLKYVASPMPFSAGNVFIRQNVDVRFLRIKTVPEL